MKTYSVHDKTVALFLSKNEAKALLSNQKYLNFKKSKFALNAERKLEDAINEGDK